MKRNKNRNKALILLILLFVVTLGYASLATSLKINGTASVNKNTWDVYWSEPVVTQGSKSMTAPTRTEDQNEPNNTKLVWNVTFDLPGEFYEFTVDAVNNGSLDAMITNIDNTVPPSLPDYIKYTVTYSDGVPIGENHLLARKSGNTPTTLKYKIRVYYDEKAATATAINAMTNSVAYSFTFEVQYGLADENAIEKPANLFDVYSWAEIVTAYNDGNPTEELVNVMKAGNTKKVALDLDNNGTPETTGHVRIANLTKPAECGTEGFSQTACGLVIEFVEILSNRRMNPANAGSLGTGSNGGWEYSDLRAYLNSAKYLKDTASEIDYTSTGFFNALPSDLKAEGVIKDTTVVSGYSAYNSGTGNYVTTDKIFIFDVKELLGPTFTYAYNKAIDKERQLDYYEEKGVTNSNAGNANKKYNNVNSLFWTRTAYSNVYTYFFAINSGWGAHAPEETLGVTPAFRLAN